MSLVVRRTHTDRHTLSLSLTHTHTYTHTDRHTLSLPLSHTHIHTHTHTDLSVTEFFYLLGGALQKVAHVGDELGYVTPVLLCINDQSS